MSAWSHLCTKARGNPAREPRRPAWRRALAAILSSTLWTCPSWAPAAAATLADTAWTANGLGVATEALDQVSPVIVPDGTGGVLISWYDRRAGGDLLRVYAQRLLGDGSIAPGWAAGGHPLQSSGGLSMTLSGYLFLRRNRMVADGSGGAIVVWHDSRVESDVDIYAQRVTAAGTIAAGWPDTGRVVSASAVAAPDLRPIIAADGSGGAFIVWESSAIGPPYLFAQHLDPDGSLAPGWLEGGWPVVNAPINPAHPDAVSDGAGGLIVAWMDRRSGVEYHIYALRIGPDGLPVPGWPETGIAVCSAAGHQHEPRIVSDGAGGAIVTWWDERAGSGDRDVYAQRITGAGAIAPGWPVDGVAVSNGPQWQYAPEALPAPGGGAYIAWHDDRNGPSDLMVQRLGGTGAVVAGWPALGVPLAGLAGRGVDLDLASDGAGGVTAVWAHVADGGSQADIRAQRVTSSGAIAPGWPAEGLVVCSTPESQGMPRVAAVADGSILCWNDSRNADADVFAGRVTDSGIVPALVDVIRAEARAGWARIEWYARASQGAAATVHRSRGGGSWEVAGRVPIDGTHRVVFEDSDPGAGRRVGYRLGIAEGGAEEFHGEVWLDVPVAPALALRGVYPNPATRSIHVRLSLPDEREAVLEVLDVQGRRIASTPFTPGRAGDHLVRLELAPTHAAGIHWVRMAHPDGAVQTRIVLRE